MGAGCTRPAIDPAHLRLRAVKLPQVKQEVKEVKQEPKPKQEPEPEPEPKPEPKQEPKQEPEPEEDPTEFLEGIYDVDEPSTSSAAEGLLILSSLGVLLLYIFLMNF